MYRSIPDFLMLEPVPLPCFVVLRASGQSITDSSVCLHFDWSQDREPLWVQHWLLRVFTLIHLVPVDFKSLTGGHFDWRFGVGGPFFHFFFFSSLDVFCLQMNTRLNIRF